ncbi:MAG: PIG-L deacetylase family protein [Acidimicrobiales bacterium]
MNGTDEARTILMVAAHPDDLDFGCAASTAQWTDQGDRVVYCIVTDGQAGGFDNTISRVDMAQIRRREQTDAAKVVGVTEIHFLGYEDGKVTPSFELRKDISRVIRQVKPDLVVTQSPQRNYERIYASHPDHLAVGEATLCAVYPEARNEFAYPELLADEGLEPHTAPEVYLVAHPNANVWNDITDTFDRKVEALLCHDSQMRDPSGLPDRMRAWGAAQAKAGGLGDDRLAESFLRIDTA